jgi:subtilase family serine protease
VTSSGSPSAFTSFGPSYDGRVKPEICARGTNSALVDTNGLTTYGNGTSFATPIMAGMMACLLQKYKTAFRSFNISTLLNSVFQTGNLFDNPTAQMGYGIPDFQKAEQNLSIFNSIYSIQKNSFIAAYNSVFKTIRIQFLDGRNPQQSSVKIYSITGSLLLQQAITDASTILRTDKMPQGIYFICVTENGKTETRKLLIQ